VEDEFQQGHIRSRKAIFTVGMSHLYKILEYLDEKKIRITPSVTANPKDRDYIAELSLQREKFGIFVILPRTLADDSQVLKMNQLDRVPSLYKKNPPL
jgi:hypothetical protein